MCRPEERVWPPLLAKRWGNNGRLWQLANGGGIFTAAASDTEVLTLDYVYIVENQAAVDAPGGIANEGTLVLRHTTIKDNAGINCSGGIGCP